jgi:hypothetical protein
MEIKSRDQFGSLVQGSFQTGVGAEIGVEYGAFSKQILSQWKGRLISVDMWTNETIYSHARKMLTDPRCMLVKDSSVNAARKIMDGALDFVYIDADHDYSSCKQDIEAWFPKVRHGGIIAGHDYLNWRRDQGAGCDFGVKAAVDEFCCIHGYKLHITTDDYWQGNPYPTWWFVKEIPRIIYYTWVSPDPMPPQFRKYIDGWKVLMPDFDIRQVSLDNIVRNRFTEEAIRRKKYSVAGHYGRCERLYATGGIYFDIDIEAAKRFDDLLWPAFFVATEKPHRVNNAVIGSAPGHPFIKECLDFMGKFDFNNPGPLGMEIETGPEMFTRIAKKFGWKEEDRTQHLTDDGIVIFNSKSFYPYYFDEIYHPGCVTEETYALHHWAATWLKK